MSRRMRFACILLVLAACGSTPVEQNILTQFFRAARVRDNTTIGDMSAMNVDMIAEPVNITAQVTSPDGKTESKPLVVTLQRASARKDGQATEGKWIIMAIEPPGGAPKT